MDDAFDRLEMLMGKDYIETARNCKVILFGVGGVGSWCAESLVRSRITNLTIVDCDCVSVSNINRQLPALHSTVGRPKVEVMKNRLMDINPDANITAIQKVYTLESSPEFELDKYDIIIDCIDSLTNKANLILCSTKVKDAYFVSSMGAALKTDPTQIKVAEFWKVNGCPLGSTLRKRYRKLKTYPEHKFDCVYSPELRENVVLSSENQSQNQTDTSVPKSHINGTLSHITAIFGFTIAGLVVKEIERRSSK